MSGTVESLFQSFNKTASGSAQIGMPTEEIPRLPSGIFQFDLATGGGIPMGRISVIYGPESSMKTTLSLKLIAQMQQRYPSKRCVFVDAEGHFDPVWATKMGVNVEVLGYAIPPSAEKMVDMVEGLLYAKDLGLVVIDSLAALTTQKELDSDAEKALVGSGALLINKFYRKSSRALGMAKMEGLFPTMICINQIRYKIGVMYGNPETMPGGPSFKFASSLTVRVYGKDLIEKSINPSLPAFKEIKCVIQKYKVPIVSQNCEFKMALLPTAYYGLKVGGVYEWNTILHYAKTLGFIVKHGTAWATVYADTGETTTYPKQVDIYNALTKNPALMDRMKSQIFNKMVSSTGATDGEQSVPVEEAGESDGLQGATGGEESWDAPDS